MLVLALGAGSALGQRSKKKSPLNGTWTLTVGPETYRIEFVEDEGDVRGQVTLPGGAQTEIDYGLLLGDELEFLTTENGVEHEWTAKVSRKSIKGQRVNLDSEVGVRFTARRAR